VVEERIFDKEDWDYLASKINWGTSFLDAKAVRIMNGERTSQLEDPIKKAGNHPDQEKLVSAPTEEEE